MNNKDEINFYHGDTLMHVVKSSMVPPIGGKISIKKKTWVVTGVTYALDYSDNIHESFMRANVDIVSDEELPKHVSPEEGIFTITAFPDKDWLEKALLEIEAKKYPSIDVVINGDMFNTCTYTIYSSIPFLNYSASSGNRYLRIKKA